MDRSCSHCCPILEFNAVDNTAFGNALSSGGDVDGDGVNDLVVADFAAGTFGFLSGDVFVYSGLDGSRIASQHRAVDQFILGESVSMTGDLNGDGYADYMAGAPNRNFVRVYAGGPPLALTDPVPGMAGILNTVTFAGAAPNAKVFLAIGLSPEPSETGFSLVNCQGGTVEVLMDFIKRIDVETADGTGTVVFQKVIPARFSGRIVRLQAVEDDTCRYSSPLLFEFP